MSRNNVRPTVVLPQPLSPTRPSVSPRPNVKLTPSTALTHWWTRANSPRRTGKYLQRSATSSSGPPVEAVTDLSAVATTLMGDLPPSPRHSRQTRPVDRRQFRLRTNRPNDARARFQPTAGLPCTFPSPRDNARENGSRRE